MKTLLCTERTYRCYYEIIEFVWTDGFANTAFTVNERTPDEPGNTTPDGSGNTTPVAPDTGDKTPVAPLLALIIGSGLMAVGFWKKKNTWLV